MGIAGFVLALAYRSYKINTADAVEDDPEDTKVLKRRLPADAPDHDRSDDPVTGAPSIGGDAFDKDGKPIPLEQLVNLEDIECYDDLHDGDFEDEPVPDWATDLARKKESEKRRKGRSPDQDRGRWRRMTISDNLMGALAPLPVLIPMLAAAATLVVGRRPRFQRVITLIALVGVVAVSGLLLYTSPTATVRRPFRSAAGTPPSASHSWSTVSRR